ncbi:phage tail tape measure protein [Ruminococcus flavefaciens]|uniref:phage tail tape measure protein n=1 Tax=Ruminococcus flavefaciens TaxID=1265 RepID=UPI0013DCA433|nr:phage tail tape measure protein [Ruminococcus flavefaciens]
MASKKIKGITIQYEGDTVKLEEALKSVESKGRKAKAEMSEVNRALKEAPDSAVLWQQKQELLNKTLESSKDKLKLLEDAQEEIQRQFDNKSIGEDQYRAFERELERARAETEKLGAEAEDAGKHVEELSGEAGKASGNLDKMGNTAESSAEGFTVLKGAVAQLAADGFEKLMSSAKEAWEEIDEGYDTIIKKTGATGQSLEELQSVADSVFGALPVEMSDTGAAVGEINTRFAATGDELESLTEYFLKYAEVNDTEVAGSVRNVSGIMKAFQEDTKNTGKVLDTLTDVGQRTGKDLNSLESELLSNSATFKELGLDIRQSAELLGQFEANGIDTSTAIKGLQKAQQEATADGKTMTEALGETIERIKGAKDETDALQIATDLFGKKGAAAMTQAIREQRFSLDDLTAGYDDMRDVVSETFEATQDAPDKAKVALNNLKLELAQLGEAVLPKVEKIVSKGVDDLPKIIKFGEEMLPLIKGVGAAYASWKIASTALKGAEAVKGLATAMKTADGAQKLLNSSMLANPAVAVTAAIVGLTVAIGALIVTQKEETDISAEVAEQFRAEQEAADAAREEIKKMKDDFNDRARDIENESKRTEDLWKELDSLADASGRVKDADKKRAEYILGELNSALGTEYTMTGNQIENYKTLASEIDKVIEKKKAQALVDQYMAMNSAMMRQNAEAQANYEKYDSQYTAARTAETEAERNFRRVTQNWDITAQEYLDAYDWGVGTKEGAEAAQQWLDAKQTTMDAGDLRQNAKQAFDSTIDYMHRLDDAEKAFAEERYDDVKDILYTEKNANKEILEDTKSSLDERKEAYKASLEKIYSDIELYSKNWRQKEANAIMQEMGEVVNSARLAGLDANEAFDETFRENVQKMLDDGFDITELAKWAKEAGLDVGDVFQEDYTKIVQDQLDKGYNISELLLWGIASGEDVGGLFTDEFTKKYQSQLDSGFDIQGLLQWATEKGYELGDVFGYNFKARYSEYLEDLYWESDPINKHSINSQADYEYWKSQGYDFHATGGTIGIGQQGIVAEAGPELLQVMNGGIKITPLSRTATNTPVGAGSGTTINNYNNTVYATVRDKYDVYGMAEDMATAERRIEQGKGR